MPYRNIEDKRKNRREYYLKNKDELLKKNRDYCEQNREKVLEQRKKYNQEHRDKRLEYLRKWQEDNREYFTEAKKIYYQENREKIRKEQNEYHRGWYQKNKEQRLEVSKRYYNKLKNEVFEHYSNGEPKCACCGEVAREFLCLDHINGGGAKQRKNLGISAGYRFYVWLRKNNYPPGYRILCHNCNQALGSFGYCPHQKPKEGDVTKNENN